MTKDELIQECKMLTTAAIFDYMASDAANPMSANGKRVAALVAEGNEIERRLNDEFGVRVYRRAPGSFNVFDEPTFFEVLEA